MATANEVRNHYYSLVPGRKCIDKAHYAAMQDARKQWAQVNRVQRGTDVQLPYDQETLIQWVKDSHLFELEYKEFSGFSSQNGFFSKTSGSHLFLALYEHFATQNLDASDIIEVDCKNFKCTFNVTDKMEELPPDEDSEGEGEEPPELSATVSASVQVVEENPD